MIDILVGLLFYILAVFLIYNCVSVTAVNQKESIKKKFKPVAEVPKKTEDNLNAVNFFEEQQIKARNDFLRGFQSQI